MSDYSGGRGGVLPLCKFTGHDLQYCTIFILTMQSLIFHQNVIAYCIGAGQSVSKMCQDPHNLYSTKCVKIIQLKQMLVCLLSL